MKALIVILFLQVFCFNAMGQRKKVISLKKNDYLLVWTCGGMAIPRYHKIFCITNTRISADISHSKCYAPKSVSDLSLIPLNDSVYAGVRDIAHNIPSELLKENSQIACSRPMVDCPATMVLARLNGKMYHWDFYVNLTDCDPLIQNFVRGIWKASYVEIPATIK